MFSSSQFDSTAAISGAGGFMSSQLTQASDLASSAAKIRDSHGLVPVTVKQISQASHSDDKSNFLINGVDVTNVTVVGMVFDKAEKATDVNFIVDDGTGRIGCRRWINESFDSIEMEAIQDGMYARVNGHLRTFQGNMQLVAFSVRPVTNFDEITFHFIECIHFQLQNSKQLQAGNSTQPHRPELSVETLARSGSNGYHTPSVNQFSMQDSVDGLKDSDQLVLDCLRQSSSMGQEKGVHVDELCQKLKLSAEKIKDSIRSLEDEGLIYSTIDEFHYKAT